MPKSQCPKRRLAAPHWSFVLGHWSFSPVCPWCNGSMTGSNPVGQGSNPWGHALLEGRQREPSATTWAHRPTGRHQFRTLEIRVQFPVGPLNIVLWPSGEGSSLTGRQSWVRVPPGLLWRCPDTPSGRAIRLKSGCLQVRVLLWVLHDNTAR